MNLRYIILLLTLISCGSHQQPAKTTQLPHKDSAMLDSNVRRSARVATADDDSVYKVGDFLFYGSKKMRFDFYRDNHRPKHLTGKGDTLFHDARYTLLGEYSQLHGDIYTKYALKYSFGQFKVGSLYKGKFAQPDFTTDPSARSFRTMIRNACRQDTVSFAGHYIIAEWGCGTECGLMAIVDRTNGKVYYSRKHLPSVITKGFYGIDYRKDSRMLIVNSGMLNGNCPPGYCAVGWATVGVYEWRRNGFVKLQ